MQAGVCSVGLGGYAGDAGLPSWAPVESDVKVGDVSIQRAYAFFEHGDIFFRSVTPLRQEQGCALLGVDRNQTLVAPVFLLLLGVVGDPLK